MVVSIKVNGSWVEVPALQGSDGEDYVLTASDKQDIADLVYAMMNPEQGGGGES